jgi:hypothetical protein
MAKMKGFCMGPVACRDGERVMKMRIFIITILEMETLYSPSSMGMAENK